MILEMLARFVVGGALVSVFALLGDMFRPKSFAGLFAAAPSVALATMLLTLRKEGAAYVALEARSMLWGAVAFWLYATAVSRLLARHRARPIVVTLAALPLWLVCAGVGWALFIR